MLSFLIPLALKMGIPARFAKPFIFAGLALLLLAALWGAKCAYDRSIIERHDLKQNEKVIKNTAAANTNAAEERAVDKTRLAMEKRETQEAIDHAKATGADPRAAYYHCVQLQQRARKAGSPTPDC